MWIFSEKFWSKLLKALSEHGPNALVFPLVFGAYLYALHQGIDSTLSLAGLIATYGGFLLGQASRQRHLERLSKVDVDKIIASRGKSVGAAKSRSGGKASTDT